MQIHFHFGRILVSAQPQPLRQADYVRVRGDAGNAIGVAQDDVGRLAADARESDELLQGPGDLSAVLFEQNFTALPDRFGLVPVKSR